MVGTVVSVLVVVEVADSLATDPTVGSSDDVDWVKVTSSVSSDSIWT